MLSVCNFPLCFQFNYEYLFFYIDFYSRFSERQFSVSRGFHSGCIIVSSNSVDSWRTSRSTSQITFITSCGVCGVFGGTLEPPCVLLHTRPCRFHASRPFIIPQNCMFILLTNPSLETPTPTSFPTLLFSHSNFVIWHSALK